MKLKLDKVIIQNLRKFKKKEVNFSSGINILVGKNATGKTTILEAISLLGVCKSFKTSNDSELIKEKEDFFYVKGFFDADRTETIISFSEKGKKVNVNGVVLKRLSDYIGKVNVVSFSPNDLNIIKGESRYKRAFLNQSISMVNKEYLNDIIEYDKILKNRNEILKNFEKYNNDLNILKIYTERLINLSKKITKEREKFIEEINEFITYNIKRITNNNEDVKIKYQPIRLYDGVVDDIYKNIYKEIEAKTTCFGIHKETFQININDKDSQKYSSHGQQKSAVVALKLAVVDYLKSKEKESIIILDDVFGELDIERQESLIKELDNKGQVFISTTDITNISDNILLKGKIIEMDEGD